MSRNPTFDARVAVAFCLASVAACVAAVWSVAGMLHERLRR